MDALLRAPTIPHSWLVRIPFYSVLSLLDFFFCSCRRRCCCCAKERKGSTSKTMKRCASKSPVRLEGNFNYSRTFFVLRRRERPDMRHRAAMLLTLGVFAAREKLGRTSAGQDRCNSGEMRQSGHVSWIHHRPSSIFNWWRRHSAVRTFGGCLRQKSFIQSHFYFGRFRIIPFLITLALRWPFGILVGISRLYRDNSKGLPEQLGQAQPSGRHFIQQSLAVDRAKFLGYVPSVIPVFIEMNLTSSNELLDIDITLNFSGWVIFPTVSEKNIIFKK